MIDAATGGEIVPPLRLNLGCGNPEARSWHPMPGFVNLDKSLGWCFEDGLSEFADRSVAGLSVSHALMYCALADWPAIFAEFARVLCDGGVIRVTEDETSDTRSRTFKIGWHDAVTLTNPEMLKAHLEAAGLRAFDVGPTETHYADDSLIQQQHGDPPDVFFVEGIRMNRVLFAPHCDDETLFAAFTILRYRPMIVTCFGSASDYGSNEIRNAETRDAMTVLGGDPVEAWDMQPGARLVDRMRELDTRVKPSKVFAPHPNTSHADHVAVAVAAAEVFGDRLTRYHTYNAAGKVRDGVEVQYETPWIQAKLRALARYESQIRHGRAHSFFLNDLREFSE